MELDGFFILVIIILGRYANEKYGINRFGKLWTWCKDY